MYSSVNYPPVNLQTPPPQFLVDLMLLTLLYIPPHLCHRAYLHILPTYLPRYIRTTVQVNIHMNDDQFVFFKKKSWPCGLVILYLVSCMLYPLINAYTPGLDDQSLSKSELRAASIYLYVMA